MPIYPSDLDIPPLQLRRSSASTVSNYVPAEGEPVWITDTKQLVVGDGTTAGGIAVSGGGGGSSTSTFTNITVTQTATIESIAFTGNAIAIGEFAGQSNQPANSIVINATGAVLEGASNSALYINPVRLDTSFTGGYIGYNSTSKELVYNTATATFGDISLTNATISATAGATGNYLRININGTFYKLQLLADS
jgi:hypothetical protein